MKQLEQSNLIAEKNNWLVKILRVLESKKGDMSNPRWFWTLCKRGNEESDRWNVYLDPMYFSKRCYNGDLKEVKRCIAAGIGSGVISHGLQSACWSGANNKVNR